MYSLSLTLSVCRKWFGCFLRCLKRSFMYTSLACAFVLHVQPYETVFFFIIFLFGFYLRWLVCRSVRIFFSIVAHLSHVLFSSFSTAYRISDSLNFWIIFLLIFFSFVVVSVFFYSFSGIIYILFFLKLNSIQLRQLFFVSLMRRGVWHRMSNM